MIDLSQVTLFCVDTQHPDLSIWSMQRCLDKVHFNEAILITDLNKISTPPGNIHLVQAPSIQSIEDYSAFLLSDLSEFISGTHMLVVQWDSFIIDEKMWVKEFLKYDYIGAPWPHHPQTPVGNGGFSLRSKKLFQALQHPNIRKCHPEDQCICIFNRKALEDTLDIQFATLELAQQFSFEREKTTSFGFHGFFNFAHALDYQALYGYLKVLPTSLLGKIDTYDLFDHLLELKRYKEAELLLNLAHPKKKMWLRHIKRLLMLKSQDLMR
jgi:hypothetical protein